MWKRNTLMRCGPSCYAGSGVKTILKFMPGWPERKTCFTWFQVIKRFLLWSNSEEPTWPRHFVKWRGWRKRDCTLTISVWSCSWNCWNLNEQIKYHGPQVLGHTCCGTVGMPSLPRSQPMQNGKTRRPNCRILMNLIESSRWAATCAFPCPKKVAAARVKFTCCTPRQRSIHFDPCCLTRWPITWLRRILSRCRCLLSPGFPAIASSCSIRYENHGLKMYEVGWTRVVWKKRDPPKGPNSSKSHYSFP